MNYSKLYIARRLHEEKSNASSEKKRVHTFIARFADKSNLKNINS